MSCAWCREVDRRTFFGLLGLGVLGAMGAVAGCAPTAGDIARPAQPAANPGASTALAPTAPTPSGLPAAPVGAVPTPPFEHSPTVVLHGPPAAARARLIAITVDDGYCAECATASVELAQQTGLHLTFNPNGRYQDVWAPLAPTLRPLIEAGQVQIGRLRRRAGRPR